MQRFFKILSYLPLRWAHALGWWLGWLAFVLARDYRCRFLAQARQAGMVARQWRPAVGAAGQLLAELPRLWLGAAVPVHWSGQGHVEQALAARQGVLFLTPHLGCFEITAQAYAQRYGAIQPMTVLFRPPRHAGLRDLVMRVRGRPGLQTASTNLSGVRQLLRALRQGQSVGLLPDQVPLRGRACGCLFWSRCLHHDPGCAAGATVRCRGADGLGRATRRRAGFSGACGAVGSAVSANTAGRQPDQPGA